MGINQVEGVLTEFGSLIPGLQAKRFDIIAAGMYVTPERCRQAAFSNPTYGVSQALLVKQGNPKNLHSYEDAARNPNARLGVVVGAIESDYAASLKVPPDRTIVFPDAVSALAGVQAGRADAYAATALTVNDLMGKAGKDSGLEKAEPFTDPVIDGRACAAMAPMPSARKTRPSSTRSTPSWPSSWAPRSTRNWSRPSASRPRSCPRA